MLKIYLVILFFLFLLFNVFLLYFNQKIFKIIEIQTNYFVLTVLAFKVLLMTLLAKNSLTSEILNYYLAFEVLFIFWIIFFLFSSSQRNNALFLIFTCNIFLIMLLKESSSQKSSFDYFLSLSALSLFYFFCYCNGLAVFLIERQK
jgi:hypothetical protein